MGFLEDLIDKNPMIDEIIALTSLPGCDDRVFFRLVDSYENRWGFGKVRADMEVVFINTFFEKNWDKAMERFTKHMVEPSIGLE